MCDDRVEAEVTACLASPAKLNSTLSEIHDKLKNHAYFNQYLLMHYPQILRLRIAIDYLLSKQGLTSRKMAETGCYRIPADSPVEDIRALGAYIKLLQDNIGEKNGATMSVKEASWPDGTRNYVWIGSPADFASDSTKQAVTSGNSYACCENDSVNMSSSKNEGSTASGTVRALQDNIWVGENRSNMPKNKKDRSGLLGLGGIAILLAVIIFCINSLQKDPPNPYASSNTGDSLNYSSSYNNPTPSKSSSNPSSSSSSSTSSNSSSSNSSSKSSVPVKTSTPVKPREWNGSTLPIPVGSHVTSEQIKAVETEDAGTKSLSGQKWHGYRIYAKSGDSDCIVWLDKDNIVQKNEWVDKSTRRSKKSSSSKNSGKKSSSGSKKKTYDDYDKDAFPDAEEFYWWYADDFEDLFDAEDYWDD